MSLRRKAREKALQILYRVDIAEGGVEENFTPDSGNSLPEEALEYAEHLVRGVIERKKEIDGTIESISEHWRLNRMAFVDRNILRIAAFELLYCPDVPSKVAIDEAVELAKRFGSEQSPPFINGILDRVYKEAVQKKTAAARPV